ncbi:N-acetylneuraminate synthase family protein [Schleiferiaceae bacterium]|nr:N-acetylneuraminate synthase family protein [Schleiferiaceae bacterium]
MNNVFSLNATVAEIFTILEKFKNKVAFLVDDEGVLAGSLTDGDLRRFILNTGEIDSQTPARELMNHDVYSIQESSIDKLPVNGLLQKYGEIPVVDINRHIIRILSNERTYFSLGDTWSTDSGEPFVIAEIGNNHQGDLQTAFELIKSAKESGADCAKFQMRTMSSLYRKTTKSNDLGAEYTLDLLSKFQLSDEELYKCFDYCRELGMMPLCTPWDLESLNKLENYGMQGYKVASADFTNYELLDALVQTGKPLIISTGMSTELECIQTIEFLHKRTSNFILLHCNSTYPTPFKDVNLKYLKTLRKISKSPVGYSGHERGISVAIAAAALGAVVIEKHFTFNKDQEGNDHKVSLLPSEFKQMVQGIKEISAALGTNIERTLTQGELINRENLAKSIIANRHISPGEIFTEDMFVFRSPGQGLQPNRMFELVGKRAQREIEEGDFLFQSDVDERKSVFNKFSFKRLFGVPVRYGDYLKMKSMSNINFVEFHLSYQDLDLNNPIEGYNDFGYSVHAPELFEDDHLLDLTSLDEVYRKKSTSNLQRTIETARDLRKHLNQEADPILIVNVGGWSQKGFLDKKEIEEKTEILKQSLAEIDFTGVELAIQTMPPYPWHFGGQQYHNLFVDPEFIDKFCSETGHKICLDVSHSMMTCNYLKIDFMKEYYQKIKKHVNYMHIVDAKDVDGEGVQIGSGDVPFEELCNSLNKDLPNVAFVPEVWQGHKDSGSGFWNALKFLERMGLC